MMRILHVLPNAGEGGVQRSVDALIDGQRRAGHNVAVASPKGPLRGVFGDPWLELPAATKGLVTARRLAFGCRKLIRQWRPDILAPEAACWTIVYEMATRGPDVS